MPLFDTIGGLGEKQAVVLDLGKKFTKFGFAGDSTPRCIIPTEIKCPESGKVRSILTYKNEDDLYALLVDFIHMLYFKHVLVSPKDRKVVIVESLLCPTVIRDTLAKVLFRHFEVSSILFVPAHLVALNTLGVNKGLVIDIGYEEALLIPVFEGVAVLKAWQAQLLGGAAIELNLRKLLIEACAKKEKNDLEKITNKIMGLPDSIIEDIKVRCCFVTSSKRAKVVFNEEEYKPPPDVNYKIGGDAVITVDGSSREFAYEVMFEHDNDQMSLPHMILDAIRKCPVDMRKTMADNLIFIGGTSMAPGFRARILEELQYLMTTSFYSEKLKIDTFKFHNPPAKENYVSWLGGNYFYKQYFPN
uniref:Actin-related protein 10 n=1 Tax=Clastoptera arizonana TaxID=38151 RepID=A0A1B6EDD0_9HEMI